MSISLIAKVFATDLCPTRRLVLLALADAVNERRQSKGCWPSVATLMRKTGLSDRAIQKALIDLETAGYITRKMRKGTSTIYYVHLDHPRNSCGGKRKLGTIELEATPERYSPTPRMMITTPSEPPSAKPEQIKKETAVDRGVRSRTAHSVGSYLRDSPIQLIREASKVDGGRASRR